VSAQESTSSSNEIQQSSTRIEDILLERLKNEPKVAKQIGKPVLFAILIIILALGTVIYFISRNPEKFAENPHQEQSKQAVADSSEIYAKRMKLAPILDSLLGVITANPDNYEAHLMLANVYYEDELWEKAKPEYEIFLGKNPDDVDARVDYGLVIAQTSGDFQAAVDEIKKALKKNPEHVNALFNAGIMTIQANLNDKKKGISEALPYFTQALAAAKKQHNDKMADQIEKIMNAVEEMKDSPAE